MGSGLELGYVLMLSCSGILKKGEKRVKTAYAFWGKTWIRKRRRYLFNDRAIQASKKSGDQVLPQKYTCGFLHSPSAFALIDVTTDRDTLFNFKAPNISSEVGELF